MWTRKHSPREGVLLKNIRTRDLHLVWCATAVGIALMLIGCGAADRASEPNPTFTVDPDALGEQYENRNLGLSLSPPADWFIVSENHREAVIEALASRQDDDEYSLQVVDIFFNTENLSLASLSIPTERNGDAVYMQDYVEAFGQTIGIVDGGSNDQAVPTMAEFTVNEIAITQFRHIQSERIVFTLIFTSPTDTLVQLDYTIPTAAYQTEGIKLESSIGTIFALR